jgi:hypothetical protein
MSVVVTGCPPVQYTVGSALRASTKAMASVGWAPKKMVIFARSHSALLRVPP